MSENEIHFEHDEERQTFEAVVGEQRAELEYRANREGKMFLTHTEVPESLQGQGIGEKLVEHVLEYVRENNYRIIPSCPFVKAYLKKHPEHMELVAPGIRIA